MRLSLLLTRRYAVGLVVAALVVVADLLTKRYAALTFAGNPVDVIPGFFGFTFVENSGAAFGFFRDGGSVIAAAAIVVTAVVFYSLRVARPLAETMVLGLILGGALGNLTDRVARGEGLFDGPVIDWVNLWVIPTFNVADAAITLAVIVLLARAWLTRQS